MVECATVWARDTIQIYCHDSATEIQSIPAYIEIVRENYDQHPQS